MMNLISNFKTRLAQVMQTRGISQAELCRQIGMSTTTLSRYANGERAPKTQNLYLIANALHVSDKWLLGYDVPMEEPLIREHLETLQFLTEDEAIRELAKILKANESTAKFDYTDDELRDILRYCRFRGEEHEQKES